MRIPKPSAAHAAHPNLTPLIDVVMVLIVFFMLVAKIGVTTGAEKMTLPDSVLGTDIKDLGNALTLNVRAGQLQQPLVTAQLTDPKTGKSAMTELRLAAPGGHNELLEALKRYRKDNPDFKVIIRGEKDMDYSYLAPVLVTCSEANVKSVNFNTNKVQTKVSQ
jgi:biopolymer transport protein ExbD